MALPLLCAPTGTERGAAGLLQLTAALRRLEEPGAKQQVLTTVLIPVCPADDHAATIGNAIRVVCLLE